MVIPLLILVLLAASAAITIFNAVKPKVSRAWMIALISALAAWLAFFVLRLYLPLDFALPPWKPDALFYSAPSLAINYENWPYAVSLVTLCTAVILTDSTRSFLPSSPDSWAGAIAITALNLVGLLAGDPLTLMFAWVVIDTIEFIHLYQNRPERNTDAGLAGFLSVRILSVIALAAGTVAGWKTLPAFGLAQIPQNAGIYFLLAAGLRLGVLPLNLPALNSRTAKQGSALLIRLAPVASSLALIARLPEGFLPAKSSLHTLLLVLASIAALYASAMWLTGKSQHETLPFWIVALASFAITCALNDRAETSRVWGVALLLSGGVLFLFDPPIRRIRFLPLLGLIGLSALPYTLAASGWNGLLGEKFTLSGAVMLLSHALLVLGFIRHAFEISGTVTGLEKHARITYPLGLILIVQTIIIIGLAGWPGILTLGVWWASLASLALTLLGTFLYRKWAARLPLSSIANNLPFFRLWNFLLKSFQQVLSLRWLYQAFAWLLERFAALVGLVNQIMDSEGGILWSLVFLAVLITLFLSGVTP
ncbi:MAG: hypothetical protein GX415_04285 [Chloroflexi bacterium]|nr:hypothetical protein [Anaerolineaceae bacterium]NLI44615.1 hypothetical protein [Chloroflexota bacterium]HOE35070.1 hypothetical protein [Anaerolineaceae bacterium]HOT25720.1 hypothetical protein [Anaerolineaceae bacterium]HQH57900.1 hypothetical protein [Anaerolineaceae bacterium]